MALAVGPDSAGQNDGCRVRSSRPGAAQRRSKTVQDAGCQPGQDLSATFVGLFCGLFMCSWNDGVTISVHSLMALTSRGIQLEWDIYGSVDGETTHDIAQGAGS